VELRAERRADRTAVGALHVAAFGDHGRAVAALVGGLRETLSFGGGLSLVADDGGAVVGHVMFTSGLLDASRRLVEVRVLSPVASCPSGRVRASARL